MDRNRLLLIQGPPGRKMIVITHFVNFNFSLITGTGKSKTCVEIIKQFVDLNYKEQSISPPEEPKIIYCAPSNKAVNVGACKMMSS